MWKIKILGYVAATILFAVIFIKGCHDSGLIGAAVFGGLIVFALFLWIAIYIYNKERGQW